MNGDLELKGRAGWQGRAVPEVRAAANMRAEGGLVGGEADDLVAEEGDELGLRFEAGDDRVDGGGGGLVDVARDARAATAVDDELVAGGVARGERGEG